MVYVTLTLDSVNAILILEVLIAPKNCVIINVVGMVSVLMGNAHAQMDMEGLFVKKSSVW